MWGRRLWWECLWRKAGQSGKQDNTVESREAGGGITIPSLPTHQHWQLNNRVWPIKLLVQWPREQDPTQGAPLSDWRADLQNGTPARGPPSMCLMCQTTKKGPREGSPLSAWRVGLWRKTGHGGLLIAGHHSCSGGSPCPCTCCAARIPTSLAAATPSCSMLTGAEMPQAKKPCAYVHRVASKCLTHRDPVDCDLPGFSVREESSPGKNAGAYWPILVAMPF